jgi:anti-sigma regulatory factor (Ser/Thr protein kinase)
VTTADGLLEAGTFDHGALFYRGQEEYAREVCSFVRQGVGAGEPVLVAVPGRRLDLVRGALGEAGQAVSFADMAVLGRNPGRIIPAIRRFADSRRPHRTRFVGEPVWAGRSAAETAEATRHEALINEALAAVPTTVLCPYDASALGPAVLADARRTHPRLVEDGARRASPGYSGTAVARAIGAQPLPSPPPGARSTAFGEQDLPALREQVSRRAVQEGITPCRAQDLVTAVHEIAANTVVHAGGAGILRIWRDGMSLVCEIADDGQITDPLAGHHPDSPHDDSGHGLRLAHELCDLVQLRSGPWGTTVRLHMLVR